MKLCRPKSGSRSLSDTQYSDMCRLIKDETVDINFVDSNGSNHLFSLCSNQKNAEHLEMSVKMFLKRRDLKINAKGPNGSNALGAVCNGYRGDNLIEIVRVLLFF